MQTYVDAARTVYHRTKQEVRTTLSRFLESGARGREQDILRDLAANGFSIVEGYYSAAQCRDLVAEVDRVMKEYATKLWRDELGSDHRAYAADAVSFMVKAFATDPFLSRVGQLYMKKEQRCFFTLANRVVPVQGSLGSGQGWHRDTPHSRQFKTLMYLSDVGAENGAFQYVPGSHHNRFLVRTILESGIKYGQNRFTEDDIERVLRTLGTQPKTFVAPAGTLIFVDSSGIHRGSPVKSGVRYALTNYFFDGEGIEKLRERGKFTGYFVDRKDDRPTNGSNGSAYVG